MTYHQLILENHSLFTKKVFEMLSSRGLSKGQPKILEYLSEHDGAVQVEIAKKCKIEPATVTSLLSRMEKQELITRKLNEENRRYWKVYLTEKGKKEAGYTMEAFSSLEEKVFDGFSPQEKDELMQYLERIRTNLSLNCTE